MLGAILGGIYGSKASQAEAQATLDAGAYRKLAGEYNSKILERQAENIAALREIETQDLIEQQRQFESGARASALMSGARIDKGSPLLAQMRNAQKMNLDVLNLRRNSFIEEQNVLSNMRMTRFDSKKQFELAVKQANAGAKRNYATMMANYGTAAMNMITN